MTIRIIHKEVSEFVKNEVKLIPIVNKMIKYK